MQTNKNKRKGNEGQGLNLEDLYNKVGTNNEQLENMAHTNVYKNSIVTSIVNGIDLFAVTTPSFPNSLWFNGVSSYASIPNATHLQFISALTIEAEFTLNLDAVDTHNTILSKEESYVLDILNGRLRFFLYYNSGPFGLDGVGGRPLSPTVIEKGKKYKVAATYDGTTMNLYIDGVLDCSYTLAHPIDINTNEVKIGSRVSVRYFLGTIGDIRLWSSARTQSQIQANIDTSLNGDETGLVGYYKMNEGEYTRLNDGSVNTHDATEVSCTWIYKEVA